MAGFVDEWLEKAKTLHRQHDYAGAQAAAFIGLLEWVNAEWVKGDDEDDEESDPPETYLGPEERSAARELERLVWDSQ